MKNGLARRLANDSRTAPQMAAVLESLGARFSDGDGVRGTVRNVFDRGRGLKCENPSQVVPRAVPPVVAFRTRITGVAHALRLNETGIGRASQNRQLPAYDRRTC